jgi:hypothetical protein
MINVNKLNEDVLDDLEERQVVIQDLSAREAFEEYCEWNGIIGYATSLTQALDNIREASDDAHTVNVIVIQKGKLLLNFAFTHICPDEALAKAKAKKKELLKRFSEKFITISVPES